MRDAVFADFPAPVDVYYSPASTDFRFPPHPPIFDSPLSPHSPYSPISELLAFADFRVPRIRRVPRNAPISAFPPFDKTSASADFLFPLVRRFFSNRRFPDIRQIIQICRFPISLHSQNSPRSPIFDSPAFAKLPASVDFRVPRILRFPRIRRLQSCLYSPISTHSPILIFPAFVDFRISHTRPSS